MPYSSVDPFLYAYFSNPYEKAYNDDGSYAADNTWFTLGYYSASSIRTTAPQRTPTERRVRRLTCVSSNLFISSDSSHIPLPITPRTRLSTNTPTPHSATVSAATTVHRPISTATYPKTGQTVEAMWRGDISKPSRRFTRSTSSPGRNSEARTPTPYSRKGTTTTRRPARPRSQQSAARRTNGQEKSRNSTANISARPATHPSTHRPTTTSVRP